MVLSPKKLLIMLFACIAVIAFLFFLLKPQAPVQNSPKPGLVMTTVQNSASEAGKESIKTSSIHSPDGKMELTMQETTIEQGSTYDFSVLEIGKNDKVQIFTKTISRGKMELPLNAWSPDDKFIFIAENNEGVTQFYVFRASGEAFSDGEAYIDVLPKFESANTEFNLINVTGWDSDTLLHILTRSKNGEKGPNYWFEIPSKALIRLSS